MYSPPICLVYVAVQTSHFFWHQPTYQLHKNLIIGWCRLGYQLCKNLKVGWAINHPSHRWSLCVLSSPNETQYKAQRLTTGISWPSIFSGLEQCTTLGLPKSTGSDFMHLGALNIPNLLISLWHSTIDCTKPDDRSTWVWAVLQGNVWLHHRKAVADTLHYVPSSFNHPPCNIAEKLTSGYKAWEFLMYFYGLGPGLLLGILPEPYYSNYCKLVYGMQLMNQHNISTQEVHNAQLTLISFVQEFKIIYCQRLPTWIHFVRPCVHSLLHLPHEVIHLGPLVCSSQWTLKCMIGNLGKEINQHSNPFANLSQHGIIHTYVNALKAMIADLDTDIDWPSCRLRIQGHSQWFCPSAGPWTRSAPSTRLWGRCLAHHLPTVKKKVR